jgi:hypothetical protein
MPSDTNGKYDKALGDALSEYAETDRIIGPLKRSETWSAGWP